MAPVAGTRPMGGGGGEAGEETVLGEHETANSQKAASMSHARYFF
jgi:hypothetical protein